MLLSFYRAVRPDARGWKAISLLAPEIPLTHDLGHNLIASGLGTAMVYLALFGVGKLLLKQPGLGLALLGLSGVSAFLLYQNQMQSDWSIEAGSTPQLKGQAAKV